MANYKNISRERAEKLGGRQIKGGPSVQFKLSHPGTAGKAMQQWLGNDEDEDEDEDEYEDEYEGLGGIGRAAYQPFDYSSMFGYNRYPNYATYSRRVNYFSPIVWRI